MFGLRMCDNSHKSRSEASIVTYEATHLRLRVCEVGKSSSVAIYLVKVHNHLFLNMLPGTFLLVVAPTHFKISCVCAQSRPEMSLKHNEEVWQSS